MDSNSGLESNKAVVRRFFEALQRGDVDAAIALFAPHGTFWSPSTRRTSTREEFARALRWVNTRLVSPMRYELDVMTAEDNRVTLLAESFATTVDGKPYNNVYNFYFELEGGLITAGREYNDTAHVWATLRAGERNPAA